MQRINSRQIADHCRLSFLADLHECFNSCRQDGQRPCTASMAWKQQALRVLAHEDWPAEDY